MTATDVLREELKQYINRANDKSLRMVKTLFEIEAQDGEKNPPEAENWNDFPAELQVLLNTAMKESEAGGGLPHEKIVEKYSKWFRK
jgi:hypothetical protein